MTARRPILVAAGIAAAVMISRLPFATERLWAWDSVLYARALEEGFHVGFDLEHQRPHAPGYILYLALANALRRVVGMDSNGALVLVSMLASAGCAAAIYLLARRFAREPLALAAAAAFAANPLVWTYSEVAFPYTLLALLSVALAAAFWYARTAPAHVLYSVSFAFGALAGFRQDLLLLLGPLWLWLVWARPWRARTIAAVAVAFGAVLWFVPSAALSGGLVAYLEAVLRQTVRVGDSYSVPAQGWDALWYNLRFTLYALGWGLLGFGVLIAAGLLARVARWARSRALVRPRAGQAFFVLWALPAVAFYIAVHIGEWGYVLSILPALYVLGAGLLEPVVAQAGPAWRWRSALAAAAGVVALAPGLLFLTSGERFSAAALQWHDDALAARTAYVSANFPADHTLILAREDFLLVRYYLPQYRTWLYDPEPYTRAGKRKMAKAISAIVIFTDGLSPRQQLEVRVVEVAPGISLSYAQVEPNTVLEFFGDSYTVREPGTR